MTKIKRKGDKHKLKLIIFENLNYWYHQGDEQFQEDVLLEIVYLLVHIKVKILMPYCSHYRPVTISLT